MQSFPSSMSSPGQIPSVNNARWKATALIFKREYQQAADLVEEALRAFQEYHLSYDKPLTTTDRINEANARVVAAEAYYRLKKYDRSILHLQQASQHFVELKDSGGATNLANTLANLARAHQQAGHLKRAEQLFRHALEQQRAINSPDIWMTHYFLGRFYQEKQQNAKAQASYQKAIEKIEKTRSRLDTPAFKIGLFAQAIQPYYALVSNSQCGA